MLNIYTEGKADKKFIEDYLKHIGIESNFSIISIDGIDSQMKVLDKNAPNFIIAAERGEHNIVIFDADTDFENRQKAIALKRDELKFKCFLLPNNKDTGNLENLLCEIINEKHEAIFDCFTTYQTCLNANPAYDVPDIKTKVYAYLGALLQKNNKGKAKEENRDYLNPDHWNLNHPYLNPLKAFLLEHI